ncbi:hypothetical protein MIDIC_500024 [Alphaproteobacteria bacterium]
MHMWNVLVIDDCVYARTTLIHQLKKLKCGVFEAANREAILGSMQQNNIDLLVTDWHIHDYTGADVIKLVRQCVKYEKIPIAVATSDYAIAQSDIAIQAGADICFFKPVRFQQLQHWLTSLRFCANKIGS